MLKILMPDATIQVRFFLPEEGGRKNSIEIEWVPGRQTGYGCPMRINNAYFDFRAIITGNTKYVLGETYVINVKFLSPDLVLPLLHVGMKIELWEGKTIGNGFIVNIFSVKKPMFESDQ